MKDTIKIRPQIFVRVSCLLMCGIRRGDKNLSNQLQYIHYQTLKVQQREFQYVFFDSPLPQNCLHNNIVLSILLKLTAQFPPIIIYIQHTVFILVILLYMVVVFRISFMCWYLYRHECCLFISHFKKIFEMYFKFG